MSVKAIFIDRDGVINEDPGENYYVHTWEEFRFTPGVKAALKRLKEGGFKIFVVSNQSGIARGRVRPEALRDITTRMTADLKKAGAEPDGVYYCEHDDADGCDCRKPKDGLLRRAAASLDLDKKHSFCIGDSARDAAAGRVFGVCTILIARPERAARPDAADTVCRNLTEAVEWVLKRAS